MSLRLLAFLLLKPRANSGGRVLEESAIEILADISDMRRGQHIVQGPESMIGR